ncbi:MAG: ABC transporter ATP-binding protein/permease [Muribaculum sp.]|nr:ABC transporter ATP-binding protein/permease [Muribaculum sp.]
MKELKRYFSYLGKYKLSYWSIFIMTLSTSVLLNLAYPYMNKMIFNALEYRDRELFGRAAGLCVLLVILNCLAPYRRYFQIRIVRKIVFDIKIRLFEKLAKMDMSYYENHHSGEALKTLNWDANSLKDSYFSHVYWVFSRVLNGVTSVIAMIVYSPALTVISTVFCLATVFCSVPIASQIKRSDKEIQKKLSRLTMRLSDILSGFSILKMYRGSSIVLEHFYRENEQAAKEGRKRTYQSAVLETVLFLLGILASFGTIGAGVFLAARGDLDYGTVMAVVSLQMGVSAMVQGFGSALTTFSASLVRAGRVFDFLEADCEERDLCDSEKAAWLEPGEGCLPIAVEGLTFAYRNGENVLENFSMEVMEGERILIMGESGCGKSTLLKLLMRFYQTDSGAIKLYGNDVQEYSNRQLRQLITYLPQESYLFEGSVRENIAYGLPGEETVPDAEIRRVAKMAYAEEFIEMLPQGYDTALCAGGRNLSGGQRQRIAIARAFLKDSPILLMDEPSSALDVQSEKMIHQAMKELMKGKVVLMVTHRRTSFEEFDRVVNL